MAVMEAVSPTSSSHRSWKWLDKFGFWKEKLALYMYKRSAKLTKIEDIRDQLTICCSEEL